MKTRISHFLTVLFLVIFVVAGCKKNNSKTPDSPVITLISPLADTIGSVITINGKFNTGVTNTVTFNGVAANINSITATAIKVTVPLNATTGKITLTTAGVAQAYPVDFTVKATPFQFYMSSFGGMPGATVLMGITAVFASNSAVIKINGIMANYALPANGGFAVTIPSGATSGKVTITLNGKTYTDGNFNIVNGTFSTFSIPPTSVSDISFDAAGNLYGTSDNKVIKINSSGVANTIASVGSINTFLGGCVADKAGNVYVSATYDYNPAAYRPGMPIPTQVTPADLKIYKITPTGAVSVFAGTAIAGLNDGPGASAQFEAPTNLAIDAAGNLYVNDLQRIRKITPDGTVSTLAGNANPTGQITDGLGVAASFYDLTAIATGATGIIYAIDNQNRLCKITAAGQVTTLPVIPTDGLPVLTSLTRVVADASGNLYIDVNGSIYFMNKDGVGGVAGIMSNTYLNPIQSIGDMNGMALDASGNIFISGLTAFTTPCIVKVMH